MLSRGVARPSRATALVLPNRRLAALRVAAMQTGPGHAAHCRAAHWTCVQYSSTAALVVRLGSVGWHEPCVTGRASQDASQRQSEVGGLTHVPVAVLVHGPCHLIPATLFAGERQLHTPGAGFAATCVTMCVHGGQCL